MDIVGAIVGSGILSAIVSGAIALISKRMDRKYAQEDKVESQNDEMDSIKKQLHKVELDNVRLQILVLMADYPDDDTEIMRVAEHYFRDLKGNWYMTSMFNNWIQKNNIAQPDWLEKE